jgi:hypothetical protein
MSARKQTAICLLCQLIGGSSAAQRGSAISQRGANGQPGGKLPMRGGKPEIVGIAPR